MTRLEPDRIICNFLRNTVTDINASRSGQWIYPDFPRVASLGNTSFPRMGITILTENGERMGINDDTTLSDITFQVDIVAKKDQVYTLTVTDEAVGNIATGLSFDYVPGTVTSISHDGTPFGTVTAVNTDADFTSPSAGTVQWSKSTGNLNFATADISSYTGQAITSTYTYGLEGKKAVQYIARDVIEQFRGSWRNDTTMTGLFYPELISSNPLPFDEELGIFRYMLEYHIKGFNAGEEY